MGLFGQQKGRVLDMADWSNTREKEIEAIRAGIRAGWITEIDAKKAESEEPDFMLQLLGLLTNAALHHGGMLNRPSSLFPMSTKLNKVPEFDCGVLALVLEIYLLLGESVQGRKSLSDFGLQPILQDVEGPGHGG